LKILTERCLLRSAFELLDFVEEGSVEQAFSVVWIVLAYLLGSIPMGVLLSRLKGQDPRKVGSGNIGATNVMRAAGKGLGAVTLLCDALKGFLPVWLAIEFGLSDRLVAAIGLAAFAGHIFPVYLKFKGGKGVATAVGVFLAFCWSAVLIDLVVFALVLTIWRYVSLGSIVAAGLMPFLLLFLHLIGRAMPLSYVVLSAIMAVLIIIKHRPNIVRLRAGTENRMGKKDKRES
jgi:glycerol-3-phosphate acyltransferase PlsY